MSRQRKIKTTLRLTEEEKERLNARVQQTGLSQQEYLRRSALDKEIVIRDYTHLKEVVKELKAIGNNQNQIAKALNGRGYVDYKMITDNQKAMEEIWQYLNAYLARPA